jgi:hypothetical protein
MDLKRIDSKVKKEALINECKGNLFEYLVGHFIARQYSLETVFLKGLLESQRERLIHYENTLRELDPLLIPALAAWAQDAARELQSLLPARIKNIIITGKVEGPQFEEWKEADLLLQGPPDIPVSLKLGKDLSYINTKSAGIRSFLSKYFSTFPDALEQQEEVNHLIDQEFLRLGHELYQCAGLPPFPGNFDDRWDTSGFPSLPGELNEEMKNTVGHYYQQIIQRIYRIFLAWWEKNPQTFQECLYPLVGLGRPEMLQLICLYRKENNHYQCRRMAINQRSKVQSDMKQLRLRPPKDQTASFPIDFPTFQLQIRVKPMNIFTVPALKVNCSVKGSHD